jgi:hypothetical protein
MKNLKLAATVHLLKKSALPLDSLSSGVSWQWRTTKHGSARSIYEQTSGCCKQVITRKKLAAEKGSCRFMHTDDPIDDLVIINKCSKQLRNKSTARMEARQGMNAENPEIYIHYIDRLSEVAGIVITTIDNCWKTSKTT